MKRLQQHRKALGSAVFLTIITDNETQAGPTFDSLWQQIDAFEARFSRFLPDSELTQFNTHTGSKVAVSGEFMALLKTCQQVSKDTAGLFNPFILPALQQAGYIGSWPRPDSFLPKLNYQSRQGQNSNKLETGQGWARIPAQSALDFGGIGKGYLLDQLGASLKQHDINDYWLSLGGDILCCGRDVDGNAWSVAVQAAADEQTNVGEITNASGLPLGIATSGITKRRGENGKPAWHHIIDPRTGQPAATDVLTATATATDALHADILAKCLVILGSQQALTFLQKTGTSKAYLQTKDGAVITHNSSEGGQV